MSVTWFHFKNASLTCLLLLSGSLLGCTNTTAKQQHVSVLDLDSTNFAHYWVAKDKLINWRTSLATSSASDAEFTGTRYQISFVVDSDGQMRQLEIINSTTGALLDKATMAETSNQQFYPTVQNSARQAVRINTSFRL
ncbi:energy transducer TonB [Shewanella gelidimarina]|uniref:energy transducer TonB n=1 Tax=Shewanella gelidimarina TaxID=56813 RepID=UPI00200E0A1C|nr:energy transducer TonB [Shewanella gelidimarina]MCL1058460.1 energy transducer TonB [Shewanella gelidimarina]